MEVRVLGKSQKRIRIVVWFFRILVGTLFLLSGLIKVNDIYGFSYKLEEYFHVFESHFGFPADIFLPYTLLIAAIIAVVETVLALNLLTGIFRHFTTTLLLIMILFFTSLTGYSAITKSVQDCGCFGEVLKLTPWQSFVKDIILTLLIGTLYVYRDDIVPLVRSFQVEILLFFLFTGGVAYATYYAYAHLPFIDFLPYHEGANLQYALTHTTPEGELIAKDYIPGTCQIDERKEDVVIFVFHDLKDLDSNQVHSVLQLANKLESAGIKQKAFTASLSKTIEQWERTNRPPFCISPQDHTVLRSMIRSNPGILLISKGIIIKKWHYNDLPSVEEILSLLRH